MRAAPGLLVASLLAGAAAGQTWTALPQDARLDRAGQAGVHLERQAEPVVLPERHGAVSPAPPAPPKTMRAGSRPPAPTPARTAATPPQETDRRAVWLALLAEAEVQGLSPDLAERIAADAAWLEAEAEADLLQRLGWVLVAAGRTEAAEHWFTRSLARDPDQPAARLGLAQILGARGDLAAAHALLAALPEAAGQRRDLASALAERAREDGDVVAERQWLLAALAEDAEALDLIERLAWNATSRQDWAEAVTLFHRLLNRERRPDWAEGLATALQAQGELAAAHQALSGLETAAPWRAALASELAEQARQEGRLAVEHDWLLAARQDAPTDADLPARLARNAAARGDQDAACAAWGEAYRLQPDDAGAAAWAGCLLASGRQDDLARHALTDAGALWRWWRTHEARRLEARGLARAAARLAPPGALPELDGALAPRVGLGLAGRDKSGSVGGSRLRLRLAPTLRYAWPLGGGWVEAEAGGIHADAGLAQAGLPFGSVTAGQPAGATRVDGAVGLELRWTPLDASGLHVRLGTTPSAAPLPATATWALGWREDGAAAAWWVEAAREPVQDSVLSRMGQTDPASGRAWGRVLRTGLAAGGYRRLGSGSWSLAGELRAAHLDGPSVADNRQLAVQAELMHGFAAPGFRYLQAGPSLGWEGYRHDLSAFTWGHGGYFSPRAYTRLGVAAQFETASRADWLLAGRLSGEWQHVTRRAAPCHPLPPPATPTLCTGDYPAERKTGLAGQIELRGVARIAPQWQLAGFYGRRHGPAYRDQVFGLELRYLFAPQARLHPEDLPGPLSRLW